MWMATLTLFHPLRCIPACLPAYLPDQSLAYDISSAPKDFKVYGKRITPAAGATVAGEGGARQGDGPGAPVSPPRAAAASDGWSLLLPGSQYDISGQQAQPIQVFEVDGAVAAAVGPVASLRVLVLSNHGHPNFTCVYRVRAHGDAGTHARARVA